MIPPASPASPAAVAAQPFCDGLLMKVGGAGMAESARLALARTIVAERLPGRWTVRLLGAGAAVVEIRRDRPTPAARRIALSTAWNHCARLRAAPAVVFAEPSLTTVGHDPDPLQALRILAPSELGLAPEARLASDGPLPCAETNPVWSLQLCRVPEAWALPPPEGGRAHGAGIVVGHPDTGYTRHPEIWDTPHPRILFEIGYDFEDEDPYSEDPLSGGFLRQPGHGTATASVLMSTVLAPQVTGVAPESRLLPLRVTRTVLLFGFGKLARAIHYALDRGAQVISISLGGPVRSRALDDATARAAAQGVIVLAAAGNIWPFAVFPARLPQVIGVGACTCEGRLWPKSARGKGVDLSAPGDGVWRAGVEATASGPVYTSGMGYGTSFAVATCAGAAALWLAFHGPERLRERYGPPGVPAVFRDLLLATARTPGGWDSTRDGVGILDAKALLEAPLPDIAPPPLVPAGWVAESALPAPPGDGAAHDRGAGPPPLSEAAAYLPDLDPGAVERAMLDVSGGAWAEVGDELLFHLATDPAFRDAVRSRIDGAPPPPPPDGADPAAFGPESAPPPPSVARGADLRSRASLRLRPRLEHFFASPPAR